MYSRFESNVYSKTHRKNIEYFFVFEKNYPKICLTTKEKYSMNEKMKKKCYLPEKFVNIIWPVNPESDSTGFRGLSCFRSFVYIDICG